jgi:hypothetical protein
MMGSGKRQDGARVRLFRKESEGVRNARAKRADTGRHGRMLKAIDAGSSEGGPSGRYWSIVRLLLPNSCSRSNPMRKKSC